MPRDPQRIADTEPWLRKASNDLRYAGIDQIGRYTGFLPALDAAWRVGHVVVTELVRHWARYRDSIPGSM